MPFAYCSQTVALIFYVWNILVAVIHHLTSTFLTATMHSLFLSLVCDLISQPHELE